VADIANNVVEHFVDFVVGEPELRCSVDRWFNELPKLLLAFFECANCLRLRDPHPLPSNTNDGSLGFEPRIGLADGHRVDRRPAGDSPHAGQEIALAQPPPGDQGVDLVDQLPVNRYARRWVDFKESWFIRHVYYCSNTLWTCQ